MKQTVIPTWGWPSIENHIHRKTSKASKAISSTKYQEKHSWLMYRTLTRPIMEYGSIIFDGSPACNIKPLNVATSGINCTLCVL